MAVAGSLTYDTKIDSKGFDKGLNSLKKSTSTIGGQIKAIVAGLGIDKLISATFSTLNNSIDSALKRIDTMNQFTRVMTTMTGSSEKANEALENIKKTVTGTAYGLDVASKSTQKFVTSGMELNKSTQQIRTWANAVSFYGDGTNETFENVTDALAKMVSKGKVEMDQLNRLTDAGIPAVQIYADMVGRSVQDVQDDLSKGRISTEQFLDGLQTAFDNGTTKFASISNAAQEAGSSWTGTFDNFKAAVTRGMVNIINSIDEGLRTMNLPTMQQMISTIGKKAEEVLGKVAKKIPMIAEKVSQIIDKLIDIIPYIEAVGMAFLSWKVGSLIQTAVQGFQKAQVTLALFTMEAKGASIAEALFNGTLTLGETLVGLFTGKVTLAQLATAGLAKAQTVLNTAMSANPIALVVLAIGALIAIFVVLWNKCEGFRNFWVKLWEKVKITISTAINFVVGCFNKIIDFIKNNWQGILLFIVNPFVGGFKLLYDNCEGFRNFINNFIENIKQFFISGWNSIVSFFTETIPQWIQNVINWFSNLPYMIGYHIGQILGNIIQFGINAWNWITVDLPLIIQAIIDWFAQLPRKDTGMA